MGEANNFNNHASNFKRVRAIGVIVVASHTIRPPRLLMVEGEEVVGAEAAAATNVAVERGVAVVVEVGVARAVVVVVNKSAFNFRKGIALEAIHASLLTKLEAMVVAVEVVVEVVVGAVAGAEEVTGADAVVAAEEAAEEELVSRSRRASVPEGMAVDILIKWCLDIQLSNKACPQTVLSHYLGIWIFNYPIKPWPLTQQLTTELFSAELVSRKDLQNP